MVVRAAQPPQGLLRRLAMRPRHQKGQPSPTRKLVRRQAGLARRERPDATPASDFAPPADKSALHTTTLSRLESRAEPRGARANLADSITSTGRKAAHSDRFSLRSAAVRRPA